MYVPSISANDGIGVSVSGVGLWLWVWQQRTCRSAMAMYGARRHSPLDQSPSPAVWRQQQYRIVRLHRSLDDEPNNWLLDNLRPHVACFTLELCVAAAAPAPFSWRVHVILYTSYMLLDFCNAVYNTAWTLTKSSKNDAGVFWNSPWYSNEARQRQS